MDQTSSRVTAVPAAESAETRAASPERETGLPPDLIVKFAEVAARRGAHVAVEAADATLTYAELDRRSNQLARRLIALGVVRDSRVGVSIPRGAGELLALLATAKAGGAYVPLDPTHPIERLQGIVEDAAPQVMLTHPDSPLYAAYAGSSQTVSLDDIARATEGYDDAPLGLDYARDQLAYILFTSGSTGRPKGVEIPRGAFANFLNSMAHTPGMAEHERLLAITTTSFDIAGLELFLPLWVGGTVVIADRHTVRDPRLLRRKLESERISIMQATPAAWRLLLEAGFRGDGTLRMFCGGEALSPELARRMLAAGAELWNLYGPTETTVWSTVARIMPDFDRITIGGPIDRTQLYVLDDAHQPVPVGQEGELWIGGHGVACGYHRRPELTEERFIQNPHGPPGDRIYRTGDLARRLPDGRFECLGRIDHQVKIRGFRIELGEIESVLRAVPGVQEALVVAAHREDGDPRLVAYWVGEATYQPLVEHARRKLPEYMVPAAYVRLERFPLNTNGKIDRKQLPAPETFHDHDAELLRPRNDLETRIAAIWRDVLGTDVGVDQDFFLVGGTSALAAQVVARIEAECDTQLSLQTFFESRTIEVLAQRLGESTASDAPIVVWLRRGAPGQPALFCLFGVAIYEELARSLPGDRPVVAMHVPFMYVPGRDAQPTIDEVARRYVELIRREQPHGPYYLAGLCVGGIVAYEVARQFEAAGEKIGIVVVLDAALPDAYRTDPIALLRATWNDPSLLRERILDSGKRLVGRLPLVRRVAAAFMREPSASAVEHAEPIDLPVDGPEIDLAVRRFAATHHRIACPLLSVRATLSETQSWVRMSRDLGWGGRATRVVPYDIHSGHLELLRAPHVASLAAAISETIADASPPSEAPPRAVSAA